MKIDINTTKWEKVEWNEWEALRCTAGRSEIIIGVSAGPRVLSLRWNDGPNLLYRDTTDFGVGEWRLFGGHRLSIAPESPASYIPDNHPCTVWIEGRGLILETTGSDGLRREWAVTPMEAVDGFDITHTLTNAGDQPWSGSLWALTCVVPEGQIISPCADSAEFRSIEVPSDSGARRQWSYGDGCVLTTSLGLRGKAGWYSDESWLALLRPDVTFMIHAPNTASMKLETQPACNVEVFSCKDYLEMETLGDEVLLLPGERANHNQFWRLLPGGFQPQQWARLSMLAKKSESMSYAS